MAIFSGNEIGRTPTKTKFKMRSNYKRNYQASSSDFESWTTTSITPDDLVFRHNRILRARSRQLMESTDFAPQFIRLCVNHIIGPDGFRFCAKSRDTNDKLDVVANKALERAWKLWGKGKACDFNAKHNQLAFDKLLLRTVAVDGEAFVQKLLNDKGEVCFRMYDPETVPIELNQARTKTKNLIRFGIEYDRFDNPVAYYFRDANGQLSLNAGYQAGNLQLTRITADKIKHVYIQDRVGLRRGFPWMAASMVRFRMIGRFEDAAMQNAIAGASKFGILSGEGADEVVDQIEENGERTLDTEAVTLYETDNDVDFHTFDSAFPSNEFSSFVKTNVRALASGVGVNYTTLSGDSEGVNFSSLKHGTSEERENWKGLQQWFVDDWKNWQYENWLPRQLMLGIPLNNRKNLRMIDLEKYLESEFRGRRWEGVDPLKTATSNAMDFKNGFNSPQRIMADRGLDYEEVIDEIAAHHEKLREKQIPIDVGANAINVLIEGEEKDED